MIVYDIPRSKDDRIVHLNEHNNFGTALIIFLMKYEQRAFLGDDYVDVVMNYVGAENQSLAMWSCNGARSGTVVPTIHSVQFGSLAFDPATHNSTQVGLLLPILALQSLDF